MAPPQHALRAEPRTLVKLELKVATMAWDGSRALWTKDASPGGIFFLYAERVLPVSGSKAVIQLGAQTVEAQVAHVLSAKLAAATHADAGFGVTFSKRQPADWWVALLPPAPNATPPSAPAPAPAAPAPAAPPAKAPHLPGPKELESAKNFYLVGMDLMRAKNFGAARQKFELASRIVPDPQYLAMPLVCNGFQYLRLGVLDQARTAFQRALLLSSTCAEAKDGLAQVALAKPPP